MTQSRTALAIPTRASASPRDVVHEAILATLHSIAPEVDLQSLRPDQSLRSQVDLDSMDWVGVLAGHARLGVEIPASAWGKLDTLDAIVDFVVSRRAGRRAAPARGPTPTARLPRPETHWILGTRVTVRPIRADDFERDAAFVRNLSEDSRYQRFMTAVRELPADKLRSFTDVDQQRHVALVATIDRDSATAIVGVVRYIVDASDTNCEFAVAVADDWHGTGLAGILMVELMVIARRRGLLTMEGFVLATNARMLRFARQLGFRTAPGGADHETVRLVCRLQEPPQDVRAACAPGARP
jgi:acetyltransferase